MLIFPSCIIRLRHSTDTLRRLPFVLRNIDHSSRCQIQKRWLNQARRISQSRGNRDAQDTQDNLVDTHSLERTLDAHRKDNAASIILRKIPTNVPDQWKWSYEEEAIKIPTIAKHLVLQKRATKRNSNDLQDYQGQPQSQSAAWGIIGPVPPLVRFPWLSRMNDNLTKRPALADKRLDTEIRAADTYFSPTDIEDRAARRAIEDVRECILGSVSSDLEKSIKKVDIIGSRASGLACATSDIDINLLVEPSGDGSISKKFVETLLGRMLRKWQFEDRSKEYASTILPRRLLRQARVPILTGVHLKTGLDFQIQCAFSGYGSIEFIKLARAEYPTITPLFRIIKQALSMRGLCDGGQRGLTSYPIFNMILVSLKIHQAETGRDDIGKQLLEFLQFWSEIDLYTTGIAHAPSLPMLNLGGVRTDNDQAGVKSYDWSELIPLVAQDPVGAIPIQFAARKNLGDFHRGREGYLMTLYEPVDPYNNLGKAAQHIKNVQATFADILLKLKRDMETWNRLCEAGGAEDERPLSLLRSLLEGDYSMYNLERNRLVSAIK